MNHLLAAITTYADYFTDANYAEFAEPMARVDSIGNSIYHVMLTFAGFAGVIILMLTGLRMTIGNSKEKSTAKDKIISSICVLAAIFLLANVINEVAGIVSGYRIW